MASKYFPNLFSAQSWAASKGYSLKQEKGMAIVDQIRYSSNKPETGHANNTVPVYGKASGGKGEGGAAGGGSGNGGSGNGGSPSNDGSYGGVMGNLALQGNAGKAVADQYAAAQAKADAANARVVADMKAQSDQQAGALQALMLQQEQTYAAQAAQQQQQLTAANAALAEQRRQADALSRAFIPEANPTAAAPLLGDARAQAGGERNTSSNLLSSLSILSGLGAGQTARQISPALVGLQIA